MIPHNQRSKGDNLNIPARFAAEELQQEVKLLIVMYARDGHT